MDSIERAIKNAFAKADARNPTTRQRVYESAWGAHERALAANATLSDAQKTTRREKIKQTISRIENEYARAAVVRQEPQFDAGVSNATSSDDGFGNLTATDSRTNGFSESAPSLDRDDLRLKQGKTAANRSDEHVDIAAKRDRPKKRRSPVVRYGIPALVLFAAGFIGLSLYNSFADLGRSPTPGQRIVAGNFAPLKEGEEPGGANWITIFQPTEAARMSVQGRAKAEISENGSNSFVRITSPGADDTVTFDVGEGILDGIAGKTATFDVIARSADGKPTQMSVNCNFGGLGDCGRKRYDVTDSQNDFLFDLTFPASQKAGSAGTISINSDLSGAGKAVEIYAIRVTTAK